MSSTNINVGLQEGRNSSRVLKPPGGGHSQIFGGAEEDNRPKPKIKHQNSSEINACFSHDFKPEKIEEINGIDKQENSENSKPETANNENEEKEIKVPQQAPTRVRVPPGGFSSGFW